MKTNSLALVFCVRAGLITGILESEVISIVVSVDKKGTTNEVLPKISDKITRLAYKAWLSCSPQTRML